MNVTDYTVEYAENGLMRLTLPCFSGEDLSASARMNDFMESLLGEIYLYADSLLSENGRHSRFICNYDVIEDGGETSVTLRLSFSVTGMPSRRRAVTVCFRDGYAVGEKAN